MDKVALDACLSQIVDSVSPQLVFVGSFLRKYRLNHIVEVVELLAPRRLNESLSGICFRLQERLDFPGSFS